MDIAIFDASDEVTNYAFRLIQHQLECKQDSVLGLATGATMEPLYARLRSLDLSGAISFNLDEYVGLSNDHPCSYAAYMRTHLFSYSAFKESHLLDGLASDIDEHCSEYERRMVECGGVDLQLLGIGSDGHIAFNEPGSSLASRTRLKVLTPMTREANAKHFPSGEEVPNFVLTMGVGTIMQARHCVLLAHGESKAEAVERALEGGVSAFCPASALQMHPKTTVILDREAASRLKLKDYYRTVFESRRL